jgi:predicted molibdopterin-dependent oxidoreductase YjgC
MEETIMTNPAGNPVSNAACGGEAVQLQVNGQPVTVRLGTVVAAAVALAGVTRFRTSVIGLPRGPLCGMGICMECRVTINGRAHCRSCQTLCEAGMEVRTDE